MKIHRVFLSKPAAAAKSQDFIALERRRVIAEASSSLGLVGQHLIATAEAASSMDDRLALERLVLRATARLIEVVSSPVTPHPRSTLSHTQRRG